MIEIIKKLDVEVTKPNIFQALVAKQYDMNTRFLKVTLKDGGTRIDVPNIETAKVVINAERKDGLAKGFDGVINDDGTVTVPLHSWMLELDGTVICDISVIDTATDDNKKLTTTSFTLIVEKAAYGGTDITTDPQYDIMVELMSTCESASASAQEALEKSTQALEMSAEANSKYDACVEATNNANAVREEIEAGGYIESLKEVNRGLKLGFWVGTQEEYDALPNPPNDCYVIITDDNTLSRYVLESGSDREHEKYVKWSDGSIEYSGVKAIETTFDLGWGVLVDDVYSGYTRESSTLEGHAQLFTLDCPLEGTPAFTKVTNVTFDIVAPGFFVFGTIYDIVIENGVPKVNIYFWCPITTESTVNMHIHYRIEGLWN